jgi:hypothetical protein
MQAVLISNRIFATKEQNSDKLLSQDANYLFGLHYSARINRMSALIEIDTTCLNTMGVTFLKAVLIQTADNCVHHHLTEYFHEKAVEHLGTELKPVRYCG